MKVLALFGAIFFVIFNVSFAEVIHSEFKPAEKIAALKEGDVFEATLKFWPVENANLPLFKKQFEKNTIFNAFYLIDIVSLETSPNNADVVELRGIFVVESTKFQPIYSFNYQNELVEIKLPDLKINPLDGKSKEFFVLDQSLVASNAWKIILFLLIVVAIVAFIKREKLKVLIEKLKLSSTKKMKDHYGRAFKAASIREDFESIYRDKEKWLALLEEKTPAHMEFFRVLNLHQYKKAWKNEDYSEVKSSFESIRRSFEK